jgi:hypothetical protein
MAEYDYLEELPEAGGGGSGTLGTAAYRDVGTEADQLPDTEDVQSMIASGGAAATGVLAVRFIESSGNYTLNDATSRLLLVIIGAGGGGEYGSPNWGYGGGAGGVTVGLVDVAGGSSQGVTVGAGGSGGTSTSNDGGAGSASSAGGLSSTGGSGGSETEYGGKGGLGSTSFTDGVLWSKRGGAGYGGFYYSTEDILDGGAGGSPWDTNVDGLARLSTGGASFATEARDYTVDGEDRETKLNLWNTIFTGMTARYGCGGAGGVGSGGEENGGDGGPGLVIMVELA